MNWFHREEDRYVEYGSSFRAAQRFGITRQLTDTVYNMNRAHLATDTLTVFESLDDADVRTAGTTYLMYRGRHRHEPQRDSALTRVAAALMRHPVLGPARALLRRHLRLAAHRLPLEPRHAGRARPPLRLRVLVPGRARPVRLPAAVAARQRLVLAQARARGPAALDRPGRPAARARDERRRWRRALPRRARDDRHGRPLAGARERARSRSRTSSPSSACSGPAGKSGASSRARSRGSPSAPPSGRRWCTRCNEAERDAMRASVVTRALAIEGVDLVMWLERDAHEAPRRRPGEPRAGRAALRPRRPGAGSARAALEPRGPARSARRARRRTGVC